MKPGRFAAIAVGVLITLAGCAQAPVAKPAPRAEKSNREVAEFRYACLKDKGWPVQLLEKNAIFAKIDEKDKARYDADAATCLKEAGVDLDAPITDEQYRKFFASFVKIQSCLERFDWKTPQRPSFESFKATYDTSPWIPWSEVPPTELDGAANKCPGIRGDQD